MRFGGRRAFITGGGGHLGQKLAQDLQTKGVHTVLFDIFFSEKDVKLIESLTTIVEGNISDTESLEVHLKGCDIVFHLAAVGMSGHIEYNKELVFSINLTATRDLAHLCMKLKIEKFVLASSVSVIFGSKALYMAPENTDYLVGSEFMTNYAASKAAAEQLILGMNSPSFRTIALRFRGIYGPGEKRSTERAAAMIFHGLNMIKFEKEGNGTAMTQYSSVDNCVHGFVRAYISLEENFANCGGKPFHILDDGIVNAMEFWHPLCSSLWRPKPFISFNYSNMYKMAEYCEDACKYLKWNPIMTKNEVNLMAINNTYSIEEAKKNLGYKPKSHDMSQVVNYYNREFFAGTHPWFIYSIIAIIFPIISFFFFYFFF